MMTVELSQLQCIELHDTARLNCAYSFVRGFLQTSTQWNEERIGIEAMLIAQYAQHFGLCRVSDFEQSRQSLENLLLYPDVNIELLLERQRPASTKLSVVIPTLAQNLGLKPETVALCNVGIGSTGLEFSEQFGEVILIDPYFAEMSCGGYPGNLARGYTHIAKPYSIEQVPVDRQTIVTFEFSLHHVDKQIEGMIRVLGEIAMIPNVVGVILIDYNLQSHPPEVLLRLHQTLFATLAEQQEILKDGIIPSILSHTRPLFPTANMVLTQQGFCRVGDPCFFPYLDPAYGDVIEGLTDDDLHFLQICKCMQMFARG